MTECPERWWVNKDHSPNKVGNDPITYAVISNMPTGCDQVHEVILNSGHLVCKGIPSLQHANAIALLPELLEEVAKALKPYDQDTKMMCMFPELRRVYNLAMGIEETKVEIPDVTGTNQEGSADPE